MTRINAGPPSGGESNAPQRPPATPAVGRPKRGGARPGAGRKRQAPRPEALVQAGAGFDITRHIDPRVQPPTWTPDLERAFLQTLFEERVVPLMACRRTGVPLWAALRHREEDARFAEMWAGVELAYQDVKRAEQQRRVMEDAHRAAYMIFDLKSTDPAYKPATGGTGVKVNIAIVDRAFGSQAALEALPERKALVQVEDAEVTEA